MPSRYPAIFPGDGLTVRAHNACALFAVGLDRMRQLVNEQRYDELDAACAQIESIMDRYARATDDLIQKSRE